jgi:hypothetical protein
VYHPVLQIVNLHEVVFSLTSLHGTDKHIVSADYFVIVHSLSTYLLLWRKQFLQDNEGLPHVSIYASYSATPKGTEYVSKQWFSARCLCIHFIKRYDSDHDSASPKHYQSKLALNL